MKMGSSMNRYQLLWWLLLILCPPIHASAQTSDVELSARWLATVDETTQQIVLLWSPSPTPNTMGYHICTGSPCIDYDTLFGQMDTTLVCIDHSPLERHTYRLHVFDSNYNVSPLTPSFGNVVLHAYIPDCEDYIVSDWNPYGAMPGGIDRYVLMARTDSSDGTYSEIYTTNDSSLLFHTFQLPDGATRIFLKVLVLGHNGDTSQSNVVMIARPASDTTHPPAITHATFDSIEGRVHLTMELDTAADYLLMRDIDSSGWTLMDTLHPDTSPYSYTDTIINRGNKVYCYRLVMDDDCNTHRIQSDPQCLYIPQASPAEIYAPNVIISGDGSNGTFRPIVKSRIPIRTYELSVFTRLGMLIYRCSGTDCDWSPSPNIPMATYTYLLLCHFEDGSIEQYTGTVTVIK